MEGRLSAARATESAAAEAAAAKFAAEPRKADTGAEPAAGRIDVAAVYDRRESRGEGTAPTSAGENGGHRPPLQTDENAGRRPAVPADAVPPDEESAAGGVAALPESESTNVWPDETAEAAFISEARGRGEPVIAVAPETVAEVEEKAKPLPKLDDLVQRIPAETRELLDELFRAKFTAVRRVRKADLKS